MSDVNEDEASLAHYGVPGMRWGRRNGSKVTTSSTKGNAKPFPRTSADHKAVNKVRAKKVSAMSNAELKAFTTRVNLERQYNQLNPGKIAKGKAYVDKALAVGAVANSVYTLYKSPVGKLAVAALKK